MDYVGGFFAINSADVPWQDGARRLGLPPGVEIKVLREGRDEVSERAEMLIRFPAGYVEPRHEHDHYHSLFVLEGEMHGGGEVLKPGDYLYGGGAGNAHGPYRYPSGCTLFACIRATALDTTHRTVAT